MLASCIIALVMLHSNELWTMESRWSTVCWLMLRNHDYLHPYLFNGLYFDKPLLSYWFIIGFAKLFGHLNELALRLPSAIAGITSIYCVYRLSKTLFNAKIGIITGWLLITSYFFVFWMRTASADMLNIAGILLGLTWYFEHKKSRHFFDYFIFFLIISLTSLCKGLSGFAIPMLGVVIDIILCNTWRQHLNWKNLSAFVIAILIYLSSFVAAELTTNSHEIQHSGIYEVFHENILRYLSPFDHQDAWYTYFIYLPIYLLPWTILLFFAVKSHVKQWKLLQYSQRWLFIFIITIFIFFSLSGSRRSYYILPIIPFIALFMAEWIYHYFEQNTYAQKQKYKTIIKNSIILLYLLLFCFFAFVQPIMNNLSFGAQQLADKVNQEISKIPNIENRNILLLNSKDNSLVFYLRIPKAVTVTTVDITTLNTIIKQSLQTKMFPIIILQKQDLSELEKKEILKNVNYKTILPPESSTKDNAVLIPIM